MKDHYLWVELHRPQRLSECILPSETRALMQGMIDDGQIGNLLLHGPAGTGKTTLAKVLCNEIGADVEFINASKDGNIDTLRTRIDLFSSTRSITGAPKVVILDEADYLNRQSTMPALRAFIEEKARHTRFIFTANHPDRIIDPLKSRLISIDFGQISNKEEYFNEMVARFEEILKSHRISYQIEALQALIKAKFPDYRKVMYALQTFSKVHAEIDMGILNSVESTDVQELMGALWESPSFPSLQKFAKEFATADLQSISQGVQMSDKFIMTGLKTKMEILEILEDANRTVGACADPELHVLYMLAQLSGVDFNG